MSTEHAGKFAQQMADLLETHFLGRNDIYAVQNEGGDYTAIRRPVTKDVLLAHCKGQRTIASYPTNNMGNTPFAIIDIDERGEAAQELALFIKRWLEHFKVPSFIEDSGRKGYHVWVIFKCWVPAGKAIRLLNIAVEHYKEEHGDPPFRLEPPFPRQLRASIEHPGNAVKLPWGIHQVTKNTTYFLDDDFAPLPDWGLQQVIEGVRVTEVDLDIILAEYPEAKAERATPSAEKPQLPCFGAMMEGVGEGTRHVASFRLACHLYRQGMPEALTLSTLLEWDHNYNKPPLGKNHVERNVRDAYGGKYKLGCADIEAAGFCSPECPVYRKRYLEGDQRVEATTIALQKLIKISSKPPTYRATIDGHQVELEPDDLLRLSRFKQKVMMELNFIPSIGMTQKQWEIAVDEKLRDVICEPAPADAADRVEVVDLITDWLENSPKAESAEDVQAGRPVERENTWYFRAKDAVNYLRAKHQTLIKPSALWSVIRDAGGNTTSVRVGIKSFSLWSLPKREGEAGEEEPEIEF